MPAAQGRSRLPLPRLRGRVVVYLFNPFTPASLAAVLDALRALAAGCDFTLVLKGMDQALDDVSDAWLPLRRRLRTISHRAAGLAPGHCFAVWRAVPPPRADGDGPRRGCFAQ